MTMEHTLEVAGETLTLHADRALFWPRVRWLLLADVHFGKGAVLRRAGVALPTGQTVTDLARIDALIAHYRPERLVVLGDLVHGQALTDTPWVEDVRRWRDAGQLERFHLSHLDPRQPHALHALGQSQFGSRHRLRSLDP